RTLAEVGKLEDQIREMQAANLTDCLIRLVYKTSAGNVRILEATYDPKSDYSTKLFMESGDFVEVPDVAPCGEYRLRLFGWSEIETLGRSPARQRDLLDRLIPTLLPTLRKREEIRLELGDNRADIANAMHEIQSVLERNNGEIRRYKE